MSAVRRGFTIVELLCVITLIAMLIALLLPGVQQAREVARKASCQNQLRNLVLGLNTYHDRAGCFPPGCTGTKSPVRLDPSEAHFSWTVQILPDVGLGVEFQRFDFGQTAYANAGTWMLTSGEPQGLRCASTGMSFENRPSSYVGFHNDALGPITKDDTGLLFLNSSVRRTEIGDGAGQTLLLGETAMPWPVNWAFGTRATLRTPDCRPPPVLPANTYDRRDAFSFSVPDPTNIGPDDQGVSLSFPRWLQDYEEGLAYFAVGGNHNSVMHVATAAGEVRAIFERIDEALFRSLVHRADAAPLGGF